MGKAKELAIDYQEIIKEEEYYKSPFVEKKIWEEFCDSITRLRNGRYVLLLFSDSDKNIKFRIQEATDPLPIGYAVTFIGSSDTENNLIQMCNYKNIPYEIKS